MKHQQLHQTQFQINYICDFKLKLEILHACLNCMSEMVWDWPKIGDAKTKLAQHEAWQSSNEVWKDHRIMIQSLGFMWQCGQGLQDVSKQYKFQ